MRKLCQSSVFVNQGRESEARGKSIKDSRDRFRRRRWWWRVADSLTFIPTRFQPLHGLRLKSLATRSNIKRRAHYSFHIRPINRRGCFRIALWFLSHERVCLSSSVTFRYLSGMDFYLRRALFPFYTRTYSSARSTAPIRKAQMKSRHRLQM